MDPSPPLVTIVDPNAPAGTADLLDHGRDPWRPSRTQVVLTGGVLLLAALATGAVAQVRHAQAQQAAARHESALDRRSVREVSIGVSVSEPTAGLPADAPEGSLELDLVNNGPAMVHVQTVQLDDGPRLPVDTGSDVIPGALTNLTMPLSGSCAPDAGRSPHTLTVRLTTLRGQPVTTVQRLASDDLLNTHVRQHCGTLTPTEALGWTLLSARTRNGWVDVVLDLHNTSVLPLAVRAFGLPAGLQFTLPHVPLVLPPAGSPGSTGPSSQVRLRVRVSDCSAFSTALQRDPATLLAVRLHGPLEDQVAHLSLSSQVETGFGVAAPDAYLALQEYCPSLFFG